VYIHLFGAVFGLAVSRVLRPNKEIHPAFQSLKKRISKKNGLFALLGR
jgi:hypothetical protein